MYFNTIDIIIRNRLFVANFCFDFMLKEKHLAVKHIQKEVLHSIRKLAFGSSIVFQGIQTSQKKATRTQVKVQYTDKCFYVSVLM